MHGNHNANEGVVGCTPKHTISAHTHTECFNASCSLNN